MQSKALRLTLMAAFLIGLPIAALAQSSPFGLGGGTTGGGGGGSILGSGSAGGSSGGAAGSSITSGSSGATAGYGGYGSNGSALGTGSSANVGVTSMSLGSGGRASGYGNAGTLGVGGATVGGMPTGYGSSGTSGGSLGIGGATIGGMPAGKIIPLYEAARAEAGDQPLAYLAASGLLARTRRHDTVIIVTGAGSGPLIPKGENDGPVGAAVPNGVTVPAV